MARPRKNQPKAPEFLTRESGGFLSHITDAIQGFWQEITCLGDEDFPVAGDAVIAMIDLQDAYSALLATKGDPEKGDEDQIENRLIDLARCALVAIAHRRTLYSKRPGLAPPSGKMAKREGRR